ncbi:MAG TPA: helix-turn-helix domain-containing protein [Pyrinomonadaceae bacterium]|nr:helix-turn-helix domain-containing protein [Pyrinomonadaceae bacterium]
MAAPSLTTKDVARLLDVSEATVKRWADDGLLSASKTAGGHRRFNIEGVARFRRERGLSPGLPARQAETDNLPRPIVNSVELRELLLRGDEAKTSDVLIDSYLSGLSLSSLFDRTITDAMRQIGDSWFKGELTVADEHLATQTILSALPKLKGILVPAEPLGLKVICCGI